MIRFAVFAVRVLARLVKTIVFMIFFLLLLRPPLSTLFPYTTLFRSGFSTYAFAPNRYACRTSLGNICPECITTGINSRSEEHTSELQSRLHLVCRLLLEKKKKKSTTAQITTYIVTSTFLFLSRHLLS